ncbi:tetratricopeptide repeat protein [Streptomyces sp. NPDC056387]|uniref:tetratricopeptide repeat protein n=1 Tax=Streptomyces sp. NPDC056387 TaxID=3345803 RepID=UPI0035E2C023
MNEAQHYLGDRAVGERIAAAVHRLLVDDARRPVLVLGTMWPEYAHRYTSLPSPGKEDPHSRVRELLAGRILTVPDTFDAAALTRAAALAEQGDRLLAHALIRARDGGRVTQDLAGAPELMRRYEQATPAARALLDAAMDARRLGVGLHLPQAFLTDAVTDYLSQSEYDQLSDDWAEAAYAELSTKVHGRQAALRRTIPRPSQGPPLPSSAAGTPTPPSAGPVFQLADYLEQHGRITRRRVCPPDSFWHAGYTHLTHPDDLDNLARAADERHRRQWAGYLRHRALDHGSAVALGHLAITWEGAGDRERAEDLARQAADHGKSEVLFILAAGRKWAGQDVEGVERLLWQAVEYGYTDALDYMARVRGAAGDWKGAEALARQAVDRGDVTVLSRLAIMRDIAGDREGAETLYQQAVDHGNIPALYRLVEMREKVGDHEGVQAAARQAADYGNAHEAALDGLTEVAQEAAAVRPEPGRYADTSMATPCARPTPTASHVIGTSWTSRLPRVARRAGSALGRGVHTWGRPGPTACAAARAEKHGEGLGMTGVPGDGQQSGAERVCFVRENGFWSKRKSCLPGP